MVGIDRDGHVSSADMGEVLQLDVADGIATITIDRPEHRNGMNAEAEFHAGVAEIVDRLREASPDALRAMKAHFVAAERMSFADFVAVESERHVALVTGPSFQAGVARFLAQREQ